MISEPAAHAAERPDNGARTTGVCQNCGAPHVHHRSYLLSADEQHGKLVLLCDDCHRQSLQRQTAS